MKASSLIWSAASGLVVVALSTFAWTNWYFSPERRLNRLAVEIREAWTDATLEAHRVVWSAFPIPTQSSTKLDPSVYCGAEFCTADFGSLFSVHNGAIKYFTVSIEVEARPMLSPRGVSAFLPTAVRWHSERTTWSVSFVPMEGQSAPPSASGDISDLSRVPRPGGSDALVQLIASLNQQVQSKLEAY